MVGTINFKWYTREEIRATPDTLFVFGDNLARVGLGGQAAAARGEPNAVGLPTKASPAEYLTDADYDRVFYAAAPEMDRLTEHLRRGGAVVWPRDGIGTGLADLKNRAPRVYSEYSRFLVYLVGLVSRDGTEFFDVVTDLASRGVVEHVEMTRPA